MKKVAICFSMMVFFMFIVSSSVFATDVPSPTVAKKEKSATSGNVVLDGTNLPSDIMIDGHFEDWENKPKASLDYDTWETDRKGAISMMTDGKNIYFFATYRSTYFDSSGFLLQVNNNKQIQMEVKLQHPNASVSQLTVKDNTWADIGQGYFRKNHIENGFYEYILEFVVPIKNLNKHGVYADKIQTMSFSNWSYGKGSITLQGTSTGPIIAVTSLAGIASIGYFFNRKKKMV